MKGQRVIVNPRFKNREEYEKWRQSKLGKGFASAGRGLDTQAQESETTKSVNQDTEPGKEGTQSFDPPEKDHRVISASPKLKICKDCGSQVSKRADKCPHCGAPVETMSSKTEGQQPQRLVVTPTKSMGVSIILTVLFGPLGMLYSTIWGGIIMGILSLVVVLPTFGLGLLITWPICIIWAAVATSSYNEKLLQGKQQY